MISQRCKGAWPTAIVLEVLECVDCSFIGSRAEHLLNGRERWAEPPPLFWERLKIQIAGGLRSCMMAFDT